ncbi:MAG: oligosaccharide flippase family protein [Bacteroidota bacterium]|nr:oligosaccharide flippase family protein [Bacteroidota bacterium]MDE2833246.1 oligosaccharide flippase family protein [Bacteroidota bacterium]MDE2957572.1 oligosaccharide flippase family protein [Bacteroidota bacterium]
MKFLDRVFSNTGFRGPLLTLLSGAGVVFIIAYFAQGVITRLYLPEEIGIGKYFVQVVAAVAAVASLRYEDALMLPEKDKDAAVLVWVSMLVLVCTVLLTAIGALWRHEIAAFIRLPGIAPYLVWVPVALLLMRTGKVAEFWLVRKRAFRRISAVHITLTSAMTGTRVLVGAPPFNANEAGHIGGFVLGHLVATTAAVTIVFRRHLRVMVQSCRWHRIKAAARRYRRFALYSTPAAAISTLVATLPLFLIPVFIVLDTKVQLGLYAQAFAAITVPMGFISRSVAHAFFVNAAEAHLKGNLGQVTTMVHRHLIMVITFPLLALLLGGPDCFEIWLGSEFRASGQYVRYIGGWLFLSAVVSPLTRVFDVTENQRLDFALGLLMLIALSTALILGGRSGNMDTMLVATGLTGLGARVVQLVTLLYLARVRATGALRAYWDFVILSLPGLGLIGVALIWQQPWVTTIAMICGGTLYAALVIWREKFYRF